MRVSFFSQLLFFCSTLLSVYVYAQTTFECDSLYDFKPTSSSRYVSTSGSDSNNGLSQASAWKTLSKAAATVTAGTTVYVGGGTYTEQLKFTKSGTESAPIIFISANRQASSTSSGNSVIDGSNLSGGNKNGVLFAGVSYVHLIGFEVKNVISGSASDVPIGVLIDDGCHHLTIANNWIHDVKTTGTTSSYNAHGLAAYGSSGTTSIKYLYIWHNELSNLVLGYSESLVMNGNVEYFDISGNLIHDNNNIGIDIIGGEGTAPKNDVARNGNVTRNIIWNISSLKNPAYKGYSADAIYCDGCASILIDNNIVYQSDLGMEVTSEHSGTFAKDVIVTNNIYYSNTLAGISLGGYDSKRGGTSNCKFNNNLFYGNSDGQFVFQYYVTNNQIKNNIFAPKSGQNMYSSYNPSSFQQNTADGNTYYGLSSSSSIQWGGGEYSSLSSFQSGQKQEANGATKSAVSGICSIVPCANGVPKLKNGCEAPADDDNSSPTKTPTSAPKPTSVPGTTGQPPSSSTCSTTVSKLTVSCLLNYWHIAGCVSDTFVTSSDAASVAQVAYWKKLKNIAAVQKDMNLWATMSDSKHRVACYGSVTPTNARIVSGVGSESELTPSDGSDLMSDTDIANEAVNDQDSPLLDTTKIIIIAVVGAVFVLAIIIGGVILYKRRQHSKSDQSHVNEEVAIAGI